MQAVQNAYATGCELINKAQTMYNNATDQVDNLAQKYLPESVKLLASKVARAIPETLFCVYLFANVLRPLSTLFWAGKTIYILFPLVKTVAQWKVAKEDTDAAIGEVKTRFTNAVNTLKPALMTSCAVMGVFAGVFGLVTTSAELLKQATLFALMSYIFYQSTSALIEAEPKPPAAPAPAPEPVAVAAPPIVMAAAADGEAQVTT